LGCFEKVELQPGQSRTVSIPFERRTLASWKDGAWVIERGLYQFAIGRDALNLEPAASVILPRSRWN
jgi:beta-glucosidase